MPARKMTRFVPNIDQTKVIITATSAERSWESMFGWTKPSPTLFSRCWRIPLSVKNRTETNPITTHETAVGRKKTERKKRQPRTFPWIRKATASGSRIATGIARTSIALFSSTWTNSGLWKRREYVEAPIQRELVPSQLALDRG